MNMSESNNLEINTCCPHCVATVAAIGVRLAEIAATIWLEARDIVLDTENEGDIGHIADLMEAKAIQLSSQKKQK